MMKRILALALVLTAVLSSAAFAWSCPSCGTENGGKFCVECGTKKPEDHICPSCGANHGDKQYAFCTECGAKMDAAPAATPAPTAEPAKEKSSFLGMAETERGSMLLLWEGDGAAHEIRYMRRFSDDPMADLENPMSLGYDKQSDSSGMTSLITLIPGEKYWVGLFDKKGEGRYEPLDAKPAAGNFEGIEGIETETFIMGCAKQKEKLIKKDVFTYEDLELAYVTPGMYVVLDYKSSLTETQQVLLRVAVTAPNGDKSATHASYALLKAETESAVGWSLAELDPFFNRLTEKYGQVPVGEYRITVYIDNQILGESTFEVVEKIAPTAAPVTGEALRIRSVTPKQDGSIVLEWKGGVPPYSISYMLKQSTEFNEDDENPLLMGRWTAETDIQVTSGTFTRLAPGQDYWLIVIDAEGKGRYVPCLSGETENFSGFTASLEITPRSRVGEERTDIDFIPADLAGVKDDVEYGVYAFLRYSADKEQKHRMQAVITMPNGIKRVVYSNTDTFAAGENKVLGWNFLSLESQFESMRRYWETLPQGDILLEIFLDGKLAASGTLPIMTPAPVNITGLAPNGDGTYSLTWENNGKGPYKILYHEKWSDDRQADLNDARTPTRWRDVQDLTETTWELKYLIPGREYWIIVEDALGTQGETAVTIPPAAVSALGGELTVSPRMNRDGAYTDLNRFSAAVLNGEHSEQYGVYLQLDYAGVPADCQKKVQLVLTLPNGMCLVDRAFDMNFYGGETSYTYWDFYALDWALERAKDFLNGELKGEYRLDFYVEGAHAGGAAFAIGE